MDLVIASALLWALMLWFHVRATDKRAKLIGCTHEKGRVWHARTDVYDRAEFLYWQCADCPLQIALVELKALPGPDVYWYTRGRELFEADHLEAIKYVRDQDPRRHG